MATITISKDESAHLKEIETKFTKIFNNSLISEFMVLAESSAKDLWDNKYDEIWNNV